MERKEYFDSHLSPDDTNDEASLILLHEQKIIGLALVRNTHGRDNSHLWLFGIDHNYRRRGIGKMLITTIIDIIRNQGIKSMSLNVDYNNTGAYNLYKRMEFVEDWVMIARSWKASS